MAAENEHKVSFGHFFSPVSHSHPDGEKLKLAYAKLESETAPNGHPYFYFSGGPGQSAIRIARLYQKTGKLSTDLETILATGPIYLIDQRGTGESEPNMQCWPSQKLPTIASGTIGAYLERYEQLAGHCKDLFERSSKPVESLDTVQSAADFEIFRQKIGADKVSVIGFSYGSHIALAYIRAFGTHVDKAILGLIEGPDHTFKLPSQFDCAVSRFDKHRTKLGKPPLARLLKSTLDSFEGEDAIVEFTNRAGLPETIRITRFEAAIYIRSSFTRSGIERLYHRLQSKHYKHMAKWVASMRKAQNVKGTYYLVNCASFASTQRLKKIEIENRNSLLGVALNFPFPYICKSFNLKPLGTEFRERLISDVPILVFSGDLDYKTPTSNAEEVISGFSRFFHVINEDGFHSICRKPKCLELLQKFTIGSLSIVESQTIRIGG